MRHVLAPPGRRVLAEFAQTATLVALDFDGTLAPIVADRHVATMTATTHAGLTRLCARYPTVVISGRGRGDVEQRLSGVPIGAIIGNHGIEPTKDMEAYEPAIRALREHLAKALTTPGVAVEDKRYSLAIHYLSAPSESAALDAIRRALGDLPAALRLAPGKSSINVLPAGAPHKGDALLTHWQRVGTHRAIFVGDDRTDEDVFALRMPDRLLAIRVGRSASSAAPWFIRGQVEIDALLAELVALRP